MLDSMSPYFFFATLTVTSPIPAIEPSHNTTLIVLPPLPNTSTHFPAFQPTSDPPSSPSSSQNTHHMMTRRK
jgi:hypothetical protein